MSGRELQAGGFCDSISPAGSCHEYSFGDHRDRFGCDEAFCRSFEGDVWSRHRQLSGEHSSDTSDGNPGSGAVYGTFICAVFLFADLDSWRLFSGGVSPETVFFPDNLVLLDVLVSDWPLLLGSVSDPAWYLSGFGRLLVSGGSTETVEPGGSRSGRNPVFQAPQR